MKAGGNYQKPVILFRLENEIAVFQSVSVSFSLSPSVNVSIRIATLVKFGKTKKLIS